MGLEKQNPVIKMMLGLHQNDVGLANTYIKMMTGIHQNDDGLACFTPLTLHQNDDILNIPHRGTVSGQSKGQAQPFTRSLVFLHSKTIRSITHSPFSIGAMVFQASSPFTAKPLGA